MMYMNTRAFADGVNGLLALIADPERVKAQLTELKAATDALKTATVEHKHAAADAEAKLALLAARAEELQREDAQRARERDRLSGAQAAVQAKESRADQILGREKALAQAEAELQRRAEALQGREHLMRDALQAKLHELYG